MRDRSHFVPRRGLKLSAALIFPFLVTFLSQTTSAAIVSGVIRDASDSTAIGFASVTASPSGYSVSANLDGGYRVLLPPGDYEIKFSHVAHYSEIVKLTVGDSAITRDIYLKPALVEVSPINVWDRQYDAAQRIIIEAIKRKDAILSQIQQYSSEAYSRIVASDTAKPDSSSCFLILESQVQSYWKYPDKQKEIITARRQTANVPAEWNLLAPGQLLNFNKNRIDLGRYAVVSPTATDALDYYDYYLIDTAYIDGRAVFVLEIEPKDENNPLFVGEIRVVDSSYAVAGVDVTFSKGFKSDFQSNERYRQVYSEFDGKYWMPTLIQFSAIVDLKAALLVYPVLAVDYVVAVHSYDFASTISDTVFGEFALEIDKKADDIDSATWAMGQMIPLTDLEQRGYEYRDSVTNHKPLYKSLLALPLVVPGLLTMYPDFFHFNRVEGAYAGVGHTFWGIDDKWDLRVKTGYAFDAKLWQYDYGLEYHLSSKQKTSLALSYKDKVRTRPTIFAPSDGAASFSALTARSDSYDYYREKGVAVGLETKLLNHTRLELGYNDFRQLSMTNSTDFGGLLGGYSAHRPNPSIVDGKLRSIEATFRYDSRNLARTKGRDVKIPSFPYALLSFGVEHASDDLIDNDFNFTRYYTSLRTAQRLFGFVVSRLYLYAGASDKALPPQKYFTVDYDAGMILLNMYFHTLAGNNFSGSRAAVLYTTHYFGRNLFRKIGIPLIKHLPFEIGIHGGVFWTDLKGNPCQPGDDELSLAPTPYGEIGFNVTRIIPWGFFSQWGANFTWQLSNYKTRDWQINISNSLLGF